MSQDNQNLRQVIVYGAGGHAKTVLAIIEAEGKYRVAGVLDDDGARYGTEFYGHRVLGGWEELDGLKALGISRAVVAIGDNGRRTRRAHALQEAGFELVSAIHPTVTCLPGHRIGRGTVILPNAFIGADAQVGENVIVSVGVIVGHDCVVGAGAQLGPRVALGGGCVMGEQTFVGMGASLVPLVQVGPQAVVGANAVVLRDLPAGVMAVGIPARIIEQKR